MTSKEIRKTFLDFFASKGHQVVPSAPMVVKGDPTLMFTNAGMNQFKEWFLGNTPAQYHRVADSQKCLRVSGKHNDLEEVGHDSYHHTMFEMLGNWSFGDYFKKEAIEWAWELLTQVYKLDPERLYATVFEGDKKDGTDLDTEALEIWERFLPKERILLGNKKDNFWEMGETGPCGPCSEIHIDLRSDAERAALPGAELVNKGHHLVIEIWNLVFMQYNRKANGELELLPQKHVDTGMGFERLVMAVNGNTSNYQGDMFTDIIAKIVELCGKEYGKDENVDVAMRVIADHIRAISFSIADGQLPSNVKAGYVIRRILRRAVRYGYTFLGFNTPFLCRLVSTLVEVMGDAYPELVKQQVLIEKVIKEEEEAFLRTLEKGIGLINGVMERSADTHVISGKDTFTLYDTFGFPLDLSELIAKEHGFTVDVKGFEEELAKQKERARNASAVEEGDWIVVSDCEQPRFVGYDTLECPVNIVKYRTVKTKGKELYQLIFDNSPFYAESGGQVGDTGYIISSETSEKIQIINTKKENNLNIHFSERIPSNPAESFIACVDKEKRNETANNHTATHLLHYALRKVLGTHIEQKGSYVNSNYLRFDFSHFEKVTHEQLREVEKIVNTLIREDFAKQEFRDIPIDEAKAMGAMALFGEKYGNRVRAVKFGDSIELCGGTHAASTGSLGMVKILSESAVAAGVRRIEATTGSGVEAYIYSLEDTLITMKEFFEGTPDIVNSVKKLIKENESYKKSIEEAVRERIASLKKTIVQMSEEINGIRLFSVTGSFAPEVVKEVAFQLYKEFSSAAMVAAFKTPDGKPSLLLMYTDDLVKNGANAGKDVKEAAKLIQGGGGGQAFLATAGGKNADALSSAFEKLRELAIQQ